MIRRELYVYPGELFSREDIIRSARELANMGHFDPEQIQPDLANVNAEAGTADVVFSLVEKANDKIELSGGWGAGMIIGSVGLTFTISLFVIYLIGILIVLCRRVMDKRLV